MKKLFKQNWFLLLVGSFLVLSAWGRINLPAFWDETKVYFRPLFWMYENNGNFFSLAPTKFDRPPGLHLFYLPFLWLFGPHVVVVRVLNVIFFYIGLFFFYKVLSRQNATTAQVTTVFFLLTPIVEVYFVQYIGDAQLFILYSAVLYALTFYKDKYVTIFILGFLSGLAREPAVFLTPAVLFYYRYENKKLKKNEWLASFGPFFGFSTAILITFLKTRLFFNHLTIDSGHINFFLNLFERLDILNRAFIVPYRILPLLGFASIMFFLNRKALRVSASDAYCLIIGLANLTLFSSHTLALPRYFFAGFPFILYLLIKICFAGSTSKRMKAIITTLILVPAIFIGTPKVKDQKGFYFMTGYQDTMEYIKVLGVHKKVIATVKTELRSADTIATSWPFISILESKYAGYGPPGEFNITADLEKLIVPPRAILWTNFPEQIPRGEIDKILSHAQYRETVFDYPPIKIRLFLKPN